MQNWSLLMSLWYHQLLDSVSYIIRILILLSLLLRLHAIAADVGEF